VRIRIVEKEDHDGLQQEMFVDGRSRVFVGPLWGCPEDAIIGRALVSCDEISGLMREAYEAGKRGEDFVCRKEKP